MSFKLEGSEEEPGTVMKRFSLYYYASDQISSTRIVTDSTGAVIYSAAHEPYGGIQQTWVGTYDPELKFSGKPRDAESGLDYFGARYYDHSLYRFLSVDPIINTIRALNSPVCWNLYAYCHNSPITFVDLDGRDEKNVYYILRWNKSSSSTTGLLFFNGQYCGTTWELPWNNNIPFQSCVPEGVYNGYLRFREDLGRWVPEFNDLIHDSPRYHIEIHPVGNQNHGCFEALDAAALNASVTNLRTQAAERGIEETVDSSGNRVINIPIVIHVDWIGYYWYNAFLTLDMIGRRSHPRIPAPEGKVSYSVVVNNWPQ